MEMISPNGNNHENTYNMPYELLIWGNFFYINSISWPLYTINKMLKYFNGYTSNFITTLSLFQQSWPKREKVVGRKDCFCEYPPLSGPCLLCTKADRRGTERVATTDQNAKKLPQEQVVQKESLQFKPTQPLYSENSYLKKVTKSCELNDLSCGLTIISICQFFS